MNHTILEAAEKRVDEIVLNGVKKAVNHTILEVVEKRVDEIVLNGPRK